MSKKMDFTLPPIDLKTVPDYSESVQSSPRTSPLMRSRSSIHFNRSSAHHHKGKSSRKKKSQGDAQHGPGRKRQGGKGQPKAGGVLITQLYDFDDSEYDTDLENEDRRRRKKKEKPRSKIIVAAESEKIVTEKQLYIKMCRNFGVVPVNYYVRNMTGTELRMGYHGLGPAGTKAISVPLQINTSITNLDLEGNWMEAEGVRHIAFMLKENLFITELNLSYNRLKSAGAQLLCKTLRRNMQIKKLDLSGNSFADKDAQYFREFLEQNTTLRDLNLSNNDFSETGAIILGKGISANDTVEQMDLSWNHIRLTGADGIAKGMRRNNGLVRLNLAMNGFGTNGAKAIGTALESNCTLTSLDLSNNRVDIDGCASIARALSKNDTIKKLYMGLNPITYNGAVALLKAVEQNVDSVLELLDLMGVLVHEEFMKIVSDMQENRPFEVNVGFVSTGKELEASGEGFSDKNPLEILLIFMSEQNLRLVDLFKSLDKDQSMSLTREEFIEGLKTVNTPLSQHQLDQLIDMLDKDGDGEVDLKEILAINKEYREIKMRARRKVSEQRIAKAKFRAAAALLSLTAGISASATSITEETKTDEGGEEQGDYESDFEEEDDIEKL